MLIVGEPVEVAFMTRLIDSAAFRLGDQAPPWLREVVVAIPHHSTPPTATPGATPNQDRQPELMSYSAVAERLGVSKTTVGRLTVSGRLTKVGRRITVASVTALLNNGKDH